MGRNLLGGVLALGLVVSACTGPDEPGVQAPVRTTNASDTAGPEPDPASSAPSAGPLRLDDSRGKGCASLRVGREYTAWEHILEPDADVTITGWDLVGANHVRAGRGFVAEVPTKVPVTGFTLGFAPSAEDMDYRTIDWEARRPATGARLAAGSRSNFWVRIQVAQGVSRADYQGLLLRYSADGQDYTALSDIRMRFRPRCR